MRERKRVRESERERFAFIITSTNCIVVIFSSAHMYTHIFSMSLLALSCYVHTMYINLCLYVSMHTD